MSDSRPAEPLERARTARGADLDDLLCHGAREVQLALLENPHLNEQHLATLLARRDLAREAVERIASNKAWMKSSALRTALLKHPHTPRRVSIPLLKFIPLFDLVAIANTPGALPELRRMAENSILAQREGFPLGQRLTLARQSSARVVAELLLDPDLQVARAALENPCVTEAAVANALLSGKATGELTAMVAGDPRWFQRKSVKLALLRSGQLSLARFAAILPELTLGELRDLAEDPRLDANLRAYVAQALRTRLSRQDQKGI